MARLTEFDAAMEIGEKVIEMADRVRGVHRVVPGAEAKWGFEMDDTRYEVVVRVVDKADDRKSG